MHYMPEQWLEYSGAVIDYLELLGWETPWSRFTVVLDQFFVYDTYKKFLNFDCF